jgi:hypothetical protein
LVLLTLAKRVLRANHLKEPMSFRTPARAGNLDTPRRRLAVESLKCCPVCGAVNARLNGECFVCRWHGKFDNDPVRIAQGVQDLIVRCPDLAEAILAPVAVAPQPLLRRLGYALARLLRRRLDLRA